MERREKMSKGTQGILRVDTSKSRIAVQSPGEPSSPQPSVDRLSVSFAPDYCDKSWSEAGAADGSGSPEVEGLFGEGSEGGGLERPDNGGSDACVTAVNMDGGNGLPSPTFPGAGPSPGPARLSANLTDEDDDYSASMNVILQRRASQRKVKGLGKRRTSSPYDSDRRRSSVFTTSSGETAITMEGEGATQEQIFENIRLHKELMDSVKQQPWDMRRKLKLIQQAKEYVKRHEGQLQERLAQSKSTKDIMARFKLLLMRYWQHFKRELSNLLAAMVPWEQRIKEIESHFGSVVASYFTFLRWIFWINIVISAILICFVMVPEILAADKTKAGQRKILLPSEEKDAAYLSTLWSFEGLLKHSPMFYGYYTDQKKTKEGYPLPLFYFVTALGVYVYSFVAILRRMAANSRQSKLSEKEDECAFSWRLFTAWDYMIGNPETAFNRFASITMGFKEALLEEKEKTKDERNWKVISLRVLANFLILLLLIFSAFAVIQVVERSETVTEADSWWRQSEITLTLTLITIIFPNIFELVGMLENNHPRKQLRWQLARIMVLNFLNLYTLIFALFGKVNTMTEQLQEIKANLTATTVSTIATPSTEGPHCTDIMVNCTLLAEYASFAAVKETKAVLVFMANLTTLLPTSPADFPLSFPFLNTTTTTASGKFNLSEWWSMMHALNPKTDLTQTLNSSSSGSTISPDLWSEAWFEYLENENYTFWTNKSSIDLNNDTDTMDLLWVPQNRTALVTAFPVIIKLINTYLATLIPTLSRTTPFVGDYSTGGGSLLNVTSGPSSSSVRLSSTTAGGGTTLPASEFSGSPILTSGSNNVTTTKPRKGKGKGNRKRNKEARAKRTKRHNPWEYEVVDHNGLNGYSFRQTPTTRAPSTPGTPDVDYTAPDWSRYPMVSEEVEEVVMPEEEYSEAGNVTQETDNTIEPFMSGGTTRSDSSSNPDLVLGENGATRKYWITKQTTRGDIPSEWDEEITSSTTTTEMTSTSSTTMAPTTTTPEPIDNLDRFLTNVMILVSLMFKHNSTKTDEPDYSRVNDFAKWITTLESVVETKKVTQALFNSTFDTTIRMDVDEKEVKSCYVTVCKDKTTTPPDIGLYLNCTANDTACTLERLLGPRDDNCWIPSIQKCITATDPPPTMQPNVSISLRKLCWETMFGQEIVKLTVMDLIITVLFILGQDFIRAILVRILNPCWCWDLEKRFPQYGDFKIAENILHLVNNQGMIWMGMFFSPGLPVLNLVKLVILLYIRSWAVMTCNVPHETVFRASRSNNFYFALLLFMLFLCTLPVAYAVVRLEPSWHCGPFSQHERIYYILTQAILGALPESMHKVVEYIASPGIVIPLLVLLVLIIYYLLSLTGALREANNDLKIQLRRERTEERRKMFKLAGGKKKDETPLAKWAMLIPMAAKEKDPSGKKSGAAGGEAGSKPRSSSILTTGKMTGFAGAAKRAVLKAREQQSGEPQKQQHSKQTALTANTGGDDDGNATDLDQASLPEDHTGHHATHSKSKSHKHQQAPPPVASVVRKPSCTDSVASTRSEIPVIRISEDKEAGSSKREPPAEGLPPSSPSSTTGLTSPPHMATPSSPSIEPEKRKRVMKALIKASKEKAESASTSPGTPSAGGSGDAKKQPEGSRTDSKGK